jgi:hypothetical protein
LGISTVTIWARSCCGVLRSSGGRAEVAHRAAEHVLELHRGHHAVDSIAARRSLRARPESEEAAEVRVVRH